MTKFFQGWMQNNQRKQHPDFSPLIARGIIGVSAPKSNLKEYLKGFVTFIAGLLLFFLITFL